MTVGRKPLDMLLAAVCHGSADQTQMQQLAELLRNDTQAMDEYLRQVDLHVLLATDPALGRASSREDKTGLVRLAKVRSRSRRQVVQAVSVAVVAMGLVLATLLAVERAGDLRQRSVIPPAETQFAPTIAVVQPPTVVIEQPMLPPSTNQRPLETQQKKHSPEQKKHSPEQKKHSPEQKKHSPEQKKHSLQFATELASPPTGNRWSTPRSHASRLASNTGSEFRLLPARYQVPRSERLADGGRRMFSVFQPAVDSRAGSEVFLSGSDALVGKRPVPHWARSRDGSSLSQRRPLWRRKPDSQLSMNINSMKLHWRKIDEN